MRRGSGFFGGIRLVCVLLLTALLPAFGRGEAAGMRVEAPQDVVRPGKAAVIRFVLPEEGSCDLVLRAEDGTQVSVVVLGLRARAGENSVHWNGTYQGAVAPEGTWRLCLEAKGETAEIPVTVGPMAPCLIGAEPERNPVAAGRRAAVAGYATSPGTLRLELAEGESRTLLAEKASEAGKVRLFFPVNMADGEHTLALTLTDAEGTVSEEARMQLTVVSGGAAALLPESFTPARTSPYDGKDPEENYWTTAMDITDEEAVWKALTAPMTVIDNGKGEKAQIILRAAPSAESGGLGSVTCETQGVHVLEQGEEWSLVECYSSSFHDSPILNWNALVQGYVPTAYLKEVVPNQELGYVVDKLTQRLYVFSEGRLFSTLLVSTGLSNDRQPYNETRSGEFLMTSKVGTFASDSLQCGMAIRFNKGDLLHEVPHTLLADGTPSYKNCEPKLGTKASHGCIRVQRKRTPEGVNMGWIWNSHKKNTRLMIWEDWQGRQMEIPAEDTLLYYNPRGGRYYHRADHCSSVVRAGVTFESFPYGDLEKEPYAGLEWCEYCAPALRRAEIEAINEVYAPGGDHDPVITNARETCPRPLEK